MSINPKPFYVKFCSTHSYYNNRNQHDAHEFLSDLMTVLQKESEDANLHLYLGEKYVTGTSSTAVNAIIDNNSIWLSTFLLAEKEQTRCMVCNSSSTSYQSSHFLQLQIPEGSSDLQLNKKSEVISKMCTKCIRNEDHILKIEPTTAPALLLIHLKRFTYKNGRV